jgi:hypothetical protein
LNVKDLGLEISGGITEDKAHHNGTANGATNGTTSNGTSEQPVKN